MEMPIIEAEAGSHGVGPEGLKSTSNAVFLLCCLSFGVGVFAIPTVMNSAGWIVGVILIFSFGGLSTALMLFTLTVVETQNCEDWESLVGLLPGGIAASRISMVASLMTANAAHLSLVSGMLFDLMEYFITDDFGQFHYTAVHKLVILALFVGIALPYTFMKDLAALQHVGKGIAGVVLSTCAAVIGCSLFKTFAGHGATGEEASPAVPADVKSIFTAMSTVAFAFTSMTNMFETFNAMKIGSPSDYMPKMRSAVLWAGVIITGVYFLVSISSILAFGVNAGSNTKGNAAGNVLYNFPPDNYGITILCLFLVVVIVLDYAIIIYPAANLFLKLTGTEEHPFARQAINIAIAVFVIVVVMVVPDLGDLFGLCGSLGVSVFCYVLPGAVCLRCHPNYFVKSISAMAVLVGLTMLFLSTFFILGNILNGK